MTAAAGAMWFAVMFALGFLLGPVREVVLAPRFGPVPAALAEAVPMILAMAFLAPWVARLFDVPRDARTRLLTGGVGLALLVLAETAMDALLRGRAMWVERFTTPDGLIGIALLLVFALMPLLRRSAG